MSLVMAFTGAAGAVMAGDRRVITFRGPDDRVAVLEQELTEGTIRTAEELTARAGALGVDITVTDERKKVRERDGILVGEVRAIGEGRVRSRRLYAAAGHYAMAEFEDGKGRPTARGGAGNFLVMGNEAAKRVAHQSIRRLWRNGSLEDAARLIARVMEEAARVTPAVSPACDLLRTAAARDFDGVLTRDLAGASPGNAR